VVPENTIPTRVTATPAAHEAIIALCASRGEPVMFVQSGGCCAGSTPMCYPLGELVIGEVDVLLGEVDGCPFYIDKRLDAAWHQDVFVLDVALGPPEGFSLGAGNGRHFVQRSPKCEVPQEIQESSR
jgi:uncharacterized protein (DUF779 family)